VGATQRQTLPQFLLGDPLDGGGSLGGGASEGRGTRGGTGAAQGWQEKGVDTGSSDRLPGLALDRRGRGMGVKVVGKGRDMRSADGRGRGRAEHGTWGRGGVRGRRDGKARWGGGRWGVPPPRRGLGATAKAQAPQLPVRGVPGGLWVSETLGFLGSEGGGGGSGGRREGRRGENE